MSARHKPANVDAQWQVDRMNRAAKPAKKKRVGDDDRGEVLQVTPPDEQQRADALWAAAGYADSTAELRDFAGALGCGRADAALALERLREARARREAAA